MNDCANKAVLNPGQMPEGLPIEALWATLSQDPTTGVALLDLDACVMFVNERACAIYFGPDTHPEAIVGKRFDELYPESFVKERKAVFEKVVREDRPVLLRTVWRGRQHLAWIYPVHTGDDEEAGVAERILIITRRTGDDPHDYIPDEGGIELMEANVIDLGELGTLSTRELVVLALLGQGLSLKEVATRVHRSEKTIQTQRDSISRKLHLRNRGELIKLVQQVGLTVTDADRLNINPDIREDSDPIRRHA